MNMMSAPLLASEQSDSQAVKQWAAEDFAITIGLLLECPYHGQPFKSPTHRSASKALATGLIDPFDPNVQIFNGDTRELLEAVERVAHHYGERCQYCVASDQEVFD